MDLIGKAIVQYHDTGQDTPLRMWINGSEDPLLYPSVFFRKEKEMSELEVTALENCVGSVLDVGAGAGCHSTVLQQRGFQVTSIEKSPLSSSVMMKRDIKNVVCGDVFTYNSQKFDTILLLMNGFGIPGTEDKLLDFLNHLKTLLNPNGFILGESTDIFYLFQKDNPHREMDLSKGYYGEVKFKMMSRAEQEEFPWIYADEFLLEALALEAGFSFEIIYRGDSFNYLCKLGT